MNILTFDVEEWYLDNKFGNANPSKFETYKSHLDNILEWLEDTQTKATFFILGEMALNFPKIVKEIATRGHEIGCHSHEHFWVNKMSQDEFKKDTEMALDAIQQLIGEKIVSYRAPAFSISENSKWAFDILSECGIINDASIFPGFRDYGGFPSFTDQTPVKVIHNNYVINEFPISFGNLPLLNKEMAFSGGGYFRILPYRLIRKMTKDSDYNMYYFHVYDLVKEKTKMVSREEFEEYYKVKGTIKNRLSRHFKSNIGRNTAFSKLKKLIFDFEFVSIKEYLEKEPIEKEIILE